jgi:hypothetical protein
MGRWLMLPALAIGYFAALKRSYMRHHGYLDNGEPTLYPGYKTDAAPYFVKHAVSDRVVTVRDITPLTAEEVKPVPAEVRDAIIARIREGGAPADGEEGGDKQLR